VARILTDDMDEHGQYRPRHGDWVDGERRAERLPRGGEDERCPICLKPRVAVEWCAACGDETDRRAA
jgi:hypothetical protein